MWQMPPEPYDADRRQRLEALFTAYHRSVLAYAMRRTDNLADAEDIVAETFIVAWRRLDVVPDPALPWLYGVARRLIANLRRGSHRRRRLDEKLPGEGAPPVTASAPDRALETLSRLRPDDQELLQLVAWEELSHGEIAAMLGISVNAVAIRLHRARQRYAAALANEVKGSGSLRTFLWWRGNVSGRTKREPR